MPKRKPNPLASAKVKLALQTEFTRRQMFLALLRDRGLPEPECQYRFAKPDREWPFDFAWLTHKLALESEGGIWSKGAHVRGAHFLSDMEKYNEAAIRGWTLIRCPSDKLATDDTISLVKRALIAIHNRED
jgi:hypothetical protein